VVSEEAAAAMAVGAARVFGADVGFALTGVAGPETQDGQPVGTVWVGLHRTRATSPGSGEDRTGETETLLLRLGRYGGDAREQIRQMAVISALDFVRRRLAGM
jgi:PncC family amidohydrolase